MESLLLRGWLSEVFTSAANATEIYIGNDKNSNVCGDSSDDDDAENSTNQRDNNEEELDPYRIENLLLDDSNDELTEHHDGADGTLKQLINMKQEARKSVRTEMENAYLSGRLWCDALLDIAISEPLECDVI